MADDNNSLSVHFNKGPGYTAVTLAPAKAWNKKRSSSITDRYLRVASQNDHMKDELIQSILNNDIDKCKSLLLEMDDDDDNINTKYYFHPLLLATKKKRCEIIELLLDNGADINVCDQKQSSALHLATQQRCTRCCDILIEKGIDIYIRDKLGNLAIHYAASEGFIGVVEKLLEIDEHANAKVKKDYSNFPNAKNKKDQTPLHMAASKGHDKILQLLINKGGRWDLKDSAHMLPLHSGAYYGHGRCCKILIEASGNRKSEQINSLNKDKATPLILAAKKGHSNCCKILEFSKINAMDRNGNTALHLAASVGFLKTVEVLLEPKSDLSLSKPDLNLRNKDGNTALHKAAMQKNSKCLQILIEHIGINDPGNKDQIIKNLGVNNDKENLIHIAAKNNCDESLRFLLKHSTFLDIINQQNKEGKTPLHLSLNQCHSETSEILLENKSDHTIQDNKGNLPLHIAAGGGMLNLCKILVQGNRFQKINDRNSVGATPLHLAAMKGSAECCKILMVKGADVNIADSDGYLPIHIAAKEGKIEVIRLFNKRGASLISKPVENSSDSVLHLVAMEGHIECCKYILKNMKKNLITNLNEMGNSALDEAFIAKNDEVFALILLAWPVPNTNEHYQAKEFYSFQSSIHDYLHKSLEEDRIIIQKAIVNSSWWFSSGLSSNFCSMGKCQNLRTMTRKNPQLAEIVYNKCIETNKNGNTEYKFEIFEDSFFAVVDPPNDDLKCKSPFDPITGKLLSDVHEFPDNVSFESHALTEAIKCHNINLLKHPLTEAYLNYKWTSYMKTILLLMVLSEGLFVLFIGLYICLTNNWDTVRNTLNATADVACHNLTMASLNDGSEGGWKPTVAVFAILILAFIMMAVTELYFLIKMRHSRLFLNLTSIIRLLRLIGIFLLVFPANFCYFDIGIKETWQWEIGIWTLLISWFHMIHTLNEIPALSVFMPITLRFAWSFLKVLFYIILIVFIFALTFHILLNEKRAFSSISKSFIKTIVWLLGDLAYDDMFLDEESPILFPVMTNIIFLLFVTSISGFIINLVITQPSDHLDEFRDKAIYHKLASRILLYLKLDSIFESVRRKYIVGFWEEKTNDRSLRTKIRKMIHENVTEVTNLEQNTSSEGKTLDISLLETILERLDEIDAKLAKRE